MRCSGGIDFFSSRILHARVFSLFHTSSLDRFGQIGRVGGNGPTININIETISVSLSTDSQLDCFTCLCKFLDMEEVERPADPFLERTTTEETEVREVLVDLYMLSRVPGGEDW